MQLQQITNLTSSQTITMSSREIAELTGKQHKHVLEDTRNMLNGLGIDSAAFAAQYKDSTGRSLPCFNLDKELTLTLVSGYNVELRNKIIKRWMELEAQKPTATLPQTYAQALLEAGRLALELEQKELQLEVAKPKVEFVDTFVDRGSNRNITSVAKELGITAIALGKWLRAKGYMNKSTKKQEWNKEFIDKGYGVQKLFNTEVKEDTFKSGSQVLVTPAGDLFIKEQVKKHGLVVYFDKQE